MKMQHYPTSLVEDQYFSGEGGGKVNSGYTKFSLRTVSSFFIFMLYIDNPDLKKTLNK